MPYVVRWVDEGQALYLGKNGWNSTTSELTKARVFNNLGAVKNSFIYHEVGYDTEVVEVQMQETGLVLSGYKLATDLKAAHQREEEARKVRDQAEKVKREQAELKRLKELYGD